MQVSERTKDMPKGERGLMPRKEVADRVKVVYDMLEWMTGTDDFDTLMCIQEWVNDNFHAADFRVIGYPDDYELEDVHLEWE